jgi:hypothetical protein
MRLHITDQSQLKVPFICGGGIVGVAGSIAYLWRTMAKAAPDPVWTRFVNVTLILFAAIYCANLLRRLVEAMAKNKPDA